MSLPQEFLYELHKHFTGDIRTDLASRILYSTDASIYQLEPSGVVLPRTQADLIAAVELAAKYKIPILPRGAGTSLAGQAVGHALVLECSRYLNQMVEINPETRSAIVEPGVVLATLNLAAAQYGLMFGPDPASAEREVVPPAALVRGPLRGPRVPGRHAQCASLLAGGCSRISRPGSGDTAAGARRKAGGSPGSKVHSP